MTVMNYLVGLGLLISFCSLNLAWADEDFTHDQREMIEQIIENYLLTHPDVIIDSLNQWQEQRRAEERRARQEHQLRHHDRLFDDPNNPIIGNPQGDVTIVEFFDYACGYCKSTFRHLDAVLQEDDNIRLVVKEFPILGPGSQLAARASLAAWEQGSDVYWLFRRALMYHSGSLTQEVLDQVGQSVGLDIDRLHRDMESEDIQRMIDDNYALARDLNINGTPAFFIGDVFIPGAINEQTLQELIQKIRDES